MSKTLSLLLVPLWTMLWQVVPTALRRRLRVPAGDLLRDATYRRLWTSILISSFGGQVTMLALPLTAAVLLHATPTQMGLLTFTEILPFVLFSLPSGVWLDRVRKLPVYVVGETCLAFVVASVPLAWAMGWLGMTWLYVVGFVIGTVYTTAGTAAQIVLTQVVARERLVEAHAKNALASSGAEVAGPGLAGALIKAFGAPLALLADALLLLVSAAILRGIRVDEQRLRRGRRALLARPAGRRALRAQPAPARVAGRDGGRLADVPQRGARRADPVRHAHARAVGAGGRPELRRHGRRAPCCRACSATASPGAWAPAPAWCSASRSAALGWLAVSVAPANAWGVAMFALMLLCFSFGAVLIFINFLALRQAVTPEPLLGPHDEHDALADPAARRARARCSAAGSASTSGCARRSPSPAALRCCWRSRPGATR